MKKQCSHRGGLSSKKGFSLIEVMVAGLLLVVAVTATAGMVAGVMEFGMNSSSESQRQAYESVRQEIARQGVDPSIVVPLQDAHSTDDTVIENDGLLTASSTTVAQSVQDGGAKTSAVIVSAYSQRSSAIGYGVESQGDAILAPITPEQLQAPVIAYDGELTMGNFPMTSIIQYPVSNPPGTVYRFTEDGSDPNEYSPIWDGRAYTIETFPRNLKVIATHPDTVFAPSEIASAQYHYTLDAIYAREISGASTLFDFDVVSGNIDRIELGVNGAPAGTYNLKYTLDGSTPDDSSISYTGAFHANAVENWSEAGYKLKVRAVTRDERFVTSAVENFNLMPQAVELSAPVYSLDDSSAVDQGELVELTHDRAGVADIYVSFDGGYNYQMRDSFELNP